MPVTLSGAWTAHRAANIGPFEYNGNLFVLTFQDTSSSTPLNVQRSEDGGATWSVWTNAGSWFSNSGISAVRSGNLLYIAVGWDNGISIRSVNLDTGVHEAVGTDTTSIFPRVNISGTIPLSLSLRSDGSFVVFHQSAVERLMGTDYRRIAYSIYSGGSWTTTVPASQSGAQENYDARGAVLGASDTVHMIYSRTGDDGNVYHLPLLSSNTLGTATSGDASSVGNSFYTSAPVFDGTSEIKFYAAQRMKRLDVNTGAMGTDSGPTSFLEVTDSNPAGLVYVSSTGLWHAMVVHDSLNPDDILYTNDQGINNWTTRQLFAETTTRGLSVGLVSNSIGVLWNDNGTVTYDSYSLGGEVTGAVSMSSAATQTVVADTNAPPTAPTLVSPTNGATIDMSSGYIFDWTHNDADSDPQAAYRFHRRREVE